MSDELLPTDRDELQDRLLDRALRERVGGEKAPDLTDKIVVAARGVSPAAAAIVESPGASARFRWGWLAIAASLLVVAGGLIWPALNVQREAARRAGPTATAGSRDVRVLLGNGVALGDRESPPSSSRNWDSMYQVETAEIPSASEAAQNNGDQVVWEELSRRRKNRNVIPTRTNEAVLSGIAPAQAPTGPAEPRGVQLGDGVAPLADSYSTLSSPVSGNGQQAEVRYGASTPTMAASADLQQLSRPSEPQQVLVAGVQSGREPQQLYYSAAAGGATPSRRVRGKYLKDDALMMGVTPRIIIQEEEEERLGVRRLREQGLGDNYAPITDNPFRSITADSADNRLSTFSIDVDTASYANVRQFLLQGNRLPPPDAVRIEELVNYFRYDYAGPTDDKPFAANIEVAACPWAPKHRLVRFGIKGREVARTKRPPSNLVFLVDISGSMNEPQKLPLLVEGMRMLTRELGENDRVAIVVYASTEGLALESTRGDQQATILSALDRLTAGGSTAGGAGIQLAYKVAADKFITGGTNRVILCTDGDFNVGVTDVEALKQLAADKAKDTGVFLTVLGFGRGNLNDELMEAVADNGNGAYHYIDDRSEARKVLVEELTGTLVTIAKDVKIQVEFNPTQVAAYRLIGYENRVLAAEDFNNDAKDAGEIGAGHTVTALYEVVPVGEEVAAVGSVDDLKYAPVAPAGSPPAEAGSPGVDERKYAGGAEASSELLTLKIRYKQPDGDVSTKLEFPVTDAGAAFAKASPDFQFASSVAGFGMLLRGSPYKGDATFAGMLEIAESAVGDDDPHGYRREFTQMMARAKQLAGQ